MPNLPAEVEAQIPQHLGAGCKRAIRKYLLEEYYAEKNREFFEEKGVKPTP